jgi:DNA/RNA endonuclease YhcR with UshA esterase domain
MKPLLLTLLAAVAICSSSLGFDEKTIEAKDSAQHVGETVVVTGTVADVHQFKGGSIVLNFGAAYPNEVFAVYIPKNLVESTGDMHDYAGKEMVVEGTIILYTGKPEIKLEDAGQHRRESLYAV